MLQAASICRRPGWPLVLHFLLSSLYLSRGNDKLKELASGCDAELLSSPSGSSLDEGQQGAEKNAGLEPTMEIAGNFLDIS